MPGEDDRGSQHGSGGLQLSPVLQAGRIEAAFQLPAAAPVALAQLPPVVPGFTGRDDELGVLAGLLGLAEAAGAVVVSAVVSAVAGLAGVGKTTLAVQAGHAARRAGWYPGGVLFIDLHGYDDQPVLPEQALDALLRALDVAAEHIPPGTEGRAGLHRSALAQISDPMLLIADNASSEGQVRPLLPGAGPHRVLVTTRHTLAGLEARLVDVTVLDEDAAVSLLDEALRAASVAAAFGLSYGKLDNAQARLFRLLTLNPGPDISTAAAAVLADLPVPETRRMLAALARAHLAEPAPGTGGRWRMHDLLLLYSRQLYSRQLAEQHDDARSRDEAAGRLLSYYLDMTAAADNHLRALPGTPVPAEFAGREQALAWLDAERPALTAAVTLAASTGRDQTAARLPICLSEYLSWRRRFDDWLTTATAGLAAARRLRDRHREGRGPEQPRRGPARGAAVRGGHHRPPGRRHLPRDRRPAQRGRRT